MPRRDLYAILGVSTRAAPEEIKRAYRRMAFESHPDVGVRPDPERFREAHEAYEMLSDPDRRRSYDIRLRTRRRLQMAEPLRTKAPINIVGDFLTLRPSIDELLDHLRRSSLGSRYKSGGPYRRLGVEAILELDEARFGCRLPFSVPAYVPCPVCHGLDQWWVLCRVCDGQGVIQSSQQVVLEIPPGVRDGAQYEVNLREAGLSNLVLQVRIVVP